MSKSQYVCSLTIPGAANSEASSLHAALSTHPDICGSAPKEPQHFSFDEEDAIKRRIHNKLFLNGN